MLAASSDLKLMPYGGEGGSCLLLLTTSCLTPHQGTKPSYLLHQGCSVGNQFWRKCFFNVKQGKSWFSNIREKVRQKCHKERHCTVYNRTQVKHCCATISLMTWQSVCAAFTDTNSLNTAYSRSVFKMQAWVTGRRQRWSSATAQHSWSLSEGESSMVTDTNKAKWSLTVERF